MMPSGVVIAHRAGNSLERLASAGAVADVVEADVHLFRGRLEVRHAKTLGPFPRLWERWYLLERDTPRLPLEEVLAAADPGIALMLDLKGADPRLPRAVLAAARERLAGPGLIVSGRIWRTVERLRGTPGIQTLHSVGSRRQLRALLRHPPPDPSKACRSAASSSPPGSPRRCGSGRPGSGAGPSTTSTRRARSPPGASPASSATRPSA